METSIFQEPLALTGTKGLVAAIILGVATGFILVKSQIAFRKTILDQFQMKDCTFFKMIFASLAVGIILFHFASKTGMVRFNSGESFFWASEIGGVICAIGIVLCGLTPSTAIASLGAGRIYAVWAFAGMLAAIPVVHFVKDFLVKTIYNCPAPFTYRDYLPDLFDSNFYLWAAGICAVLYLFFEFMPTGGDEKSE